MLLTFIGRGNVATQMAARFRQQGHRIAQMCRRGEMPRPGSDVYIVAITDDSIAPVLESVPAIPQALWVHTSGSVGIDVFDPEKFPRCGVIYPLQTILKDVPTDWDNVPIFVEQVSRPATPDVTVDHLARILSPNVTPLDSLSRRRLHAAAVMVCNLTMQLWSLGEEAMRSAGLPFHLLEPLMRRTLERSLQGDIASAITGPARRGDLGTIRSHIDSLPPQAAETYQFLTNQILQRFHP